MKLWNEIRFWARCALFLTCLPFVMLKDYICGTDTWVPGSRFKVKNQGEKP